MELLIVIGVLGILAVGLLAAIDPFEQLKKARDTNNRNAATELLQANQRYYATHGYLPWFKQTVSGTYDCALATLTDVNTEVGTGPWPAVIANKSVSTNHNAAVKTCIDNTLLKDGEVKSTFFDGLSTDLYISSGEKTRVQVCFSPEARSNRTDASTKYIWDSGTSSVVTSLQGHTCPDTTAADSTCLQCYQ